MMKSKLLNSLILAALTVPAVAMADTAPASPFSGNISLTTNYLYRGISQTGGKPAVQGGFDYANPNGFYVGTWGSNISWISDAATTAGATNSTTAVAGASGASLELDTYGGYRGSFATDYSFDVGFLRYNYLGYYSPGMTKADTNEIYGMIGWKWFTLKYSNSLGDTFGVPSASGTNYIDLSASYTPDGTDITLGAHYGKQNYKGSAADLDKSIGLDPSYSDYKLSVSKPWGAYVWAAAYSSTNATKGGLYSLTQADGTTTDLGKGTVVVSV
ncbi:MAG: TorF family putative porin, partial [Gallionella sp.]